MPPQKTAKKECYPVAVDCWLPLFVSKGSCLLLSLIILFLLTGSADAKSFGLLGEWRYRGTGGENTDYVGAFQQSYRAVGAAGPELTYTPTRAISSSASLSYKRSESGQGAGFATYETLTPAAQVGVLNDVFDLRLSGYTLSQNRRGSGLVKKNQRWDATLASMWQVPRWPQLRFNYGHYTDPVNSSEGKVSGMVMDWDLALAKLFYQYNSSKIENSINNSEAENNSHFVRFETDGKFFKDRIRLGFAQQFRETTQNNANYNPPLAVHLYVKVDTLDALRPTDLTFDSDLYYEGLSTNLLLQDSDFETKALAVNTSQSIHINGRFDVKQDVAIVHIIPSLDQPLTSVQVASLSWDIYTRDSSLDDWAFVGTRTGGNFDSTDKSFDVSIDREAKEFLLITPNTLGPADWELSEVQFFKPGTEGSSSSTSTSYLTDLDLRYKITETLTAGANITVEDYTTKNSFATNTKNAHQRLNCNLRWTPVPYISPSVAFSQDRQSYTGELDQVRRSYALNIYTKPLPIMAVNLSTTINEQFSGAQKIRSTIRYNLGARAPIYPDLTASWNLGYLDTEKLNSEDLVEGSNTLYSSLRLNANLTQALTADIDSSYTNIKQPTGTREGADGKFGLKYNFSNDLRVFGTYWARFLDNETPDKLTVTLDVTLLRNQKTNLNLSSVYTQTREEKSDTFQLHGSWKISKSLTLLARGNYVMAESYSYNFQTFLTLQL